MSAIVNDGALRINWVPPGPVCAAFVESIAPLSAIMGPIGSGKTTGCLIKPILAAAMQRPSPVDGVRRHRHLVLRDTFVNLQRTVLKSWHELVPKDVGTYVEGPPARHTIVFDMGRGPIELQMDFMGIGDNSVENLLRSYEMTSFHWDEVDLSSYESLAWVQQRAGRYPSKMHGGPRWFGGWVSFNAPEQDHWLHELLVEGIVPGSEGKPASGADFFVQPGGMDPKAENKQNLPKGYYERVVASQPDWLVRRVVHNQWGYSRDGKPVYPEYRDSLHVAAAPLKAVKGIPIGIGLDGGGTPAAAFGQKLPGGRWRILGEIATGPGTGPHRFGDMIVEFIETRFPEHTLDQFYGWADPSSVFGEDEVDDRDPHWLAKVRKVTGIAFKPTDTNAPAMRQEATRQVLSGLYDGEPRFLLCPSCKRLRKGFNSGYRYKKVRMMGGDNRYEAKPEKNEYSHLNEACEYLILGGDNGVAGVMGRKRVEQPMAAMADSDYSIFGD